MLVQSIPYPIAALSSIELVGYKSVGWDGDGNTKSISLTDLTGGLDTEPSQFDFVVVSFAVISSSSGDMALSPATSGYTVHCDIYKDDTVTLNFGVFSKFMGASPDSSVVMQTVPLATGNNNWAIARIEVWRGVDISNSMDVAVVTNSGIDTATATTPAITPTTAGAWVIDCAAACVGNGLNLATMGNPGSFSPFEASVQGKGSSCMGAKAWVSGAMGPYSHSGGSDSTACWAALQMALRPGSWTAPSFSVAATISSANGFYAEGDTLSVTSTHNGLSEAIQWKRDGVEISGATSSTYALTADDVGTIITVTVTASNPAANTESTSAGTSTIVTPTYATQTVTLSDASTVTLSDSSSLEISNRTA